MPIVSLLCCQVEVYVSGLIINWNVLILGSVYQTYTVSDGTYWFFIYLIRRSQWQCGLSRGSANAHWLGLRVRILPGAWMPIVSLLCCQVEVYVSGWSLFQSPTNYGVSGSDRETPMRPWLISVRCAMGENTCSKNV